MVSTMGNYTAILVADTDPAFEGIKERYPFRGFPTVYFTRNDGTLVDQVVGAVPPAEFDRVAKAALAAAR